MFHKFTASLCGSERTRCTNPVLAERCEAQLQIIEDILDILETD